MEKKSWYSSRTLWVSVIVFVGALLQEFGVISVPISPDAQVIILSMIAFVLRLITKKPIVWSANR